MTIVKWPQDKLGQFSLLEWCSYILEKGNPIHMKKDLSAKEGKGVQVMIQLSNNNDSPIEALQTTSLPLRTIWLSTIMHPHFPDHHVHKGQWHDNFYLPLVQELHLLIQLWGLSHANTPTHMPLFEKVTFATIAGIDRWKNMHLMPLKLVGQHIIPLEYYEGSYQWPWG